MDAWIDGHVKVRGRVMVKCERVCRCNVGCRFDKRSCFALVMHVTINSRNLLIFVASIVSRSELRRILRTYIRYPPSFILRILYTHATTYIHY